MAGTASRMCALTTLTTLLLAGSIAGQGACADTRGGLVTPGRVERDIRRFGFAGTENVMGLLGIRPGMTILDIGAGTGQFAYEFSRRLNGTGKVYATDTQAECIDYIKKEAGRRGLSNLHPVLVRKDGVDEFYGRHRYDLITVFHVFMPYEDRVDYFRELNGFLAEDGRLILILYQSPAPYSPADFTGNFRGLIKELSLESSDSPYYRSLRDATRKRIRDNPDGESSVDLRRALVEDFNAILSDTAFFSRFLDGSVFRKDIGFSPEERVFADWLLLSFKDTDRKVLNTDIKTSGIAGANDINTAQMNRLRAMNKLLITQKFRRFLKRDGAFVSGLTPPIRAVFEKAGYRLEREYPDVIPFEDIVVFAAH